MDWRWFWQQDVLKKAKPNVIFIYHFIFLLPLMGTCRLKKCLWCLSFCSCSILKYLILNYLQRKKITFVSKIVFSFTWLRCFHGYRRAGLGWKNTSIHDSYKAFRKQRSTQRQVKNYLNIYLGVLVFPDLKSFVLKLF